MREAQLGNDGKKLLRELLEEYKDVFARNEFDVGEFKWPESDFHIKLKDEKQAQKECFQPCRPLHNQIKYEEVKRQIGQLLARKMVRRSLSPYASPILLVPKPHSTEWRMCVDYRRMNEFTVKDRYPIRSIEPMLRRLARFKCFSSFDMRGGYFHCKVAADSIPKTAFITPFGLYEQLRMGFGLSNAPAHFQRCMDRVFGDSANAEVYLDDMTLGSDTELGQLEVLRDMFERARQAGIKYNAGKCEFVRSEVQFLGHTVKHGEISANSKYVSKVLKMVPPKNKDELLSWFGAVCWIGKFLPRLA